MEEQNNNDNPIYSDTAYDDAFRTMETECDDLVIPFVNHMFGETYDKTAVIKRLRNEHFIECADGSEEKRITDSHFEITAANITKKYHLECESKKYDGSILIRIFEYDAQIAVDDCKNCTNVLRVKFPNTGLLLLRKSNSIVDKAKIEIEVSSGEVVSYDVPLIKMSDYTIDNIFDKKLYMLIPFYIFNFEEQLVEMNKDSVELEKMIKTYNNMYDRLAAEMELGNLSPLSFGAIIRLTHSVAYKLTNKHSNVQKKVGDFMGGKVLDLPEIRIYKQGKAEGKAEGEEERKALADENKNLIDEINRLQQELDKYKNNNK